MELVKCQQQTVLCQSTKHAVAVLPQAIRQYHTDVHLQKTQNFVTREYLGTILLASGVAVALWLILHKQDSDNTPISFAILAEENIASDTVIDETMPAGKSRSEAAAQARRALEQILRKHGASDAKLSKEELSAIIDELLVVLMLEKGAPGIACMVSVDGTVVYKSAFGYADIENRVPVDAGRTLFRIASISKPLTTTALGILIERGCVDLDKPVQEYLKDYPLAPAKIAGKKNLASEKSDVAAEEKDKQQKVELSKELYSMTIRQLASHTSGVRHYKDLEFESNVHYPKLHDALQVFSKDPLEFVPGDKYFYTTHGYTLISAVIEQALKNHEPAAEHKSFHSFMNSEVFARLGMHDTRFGYEHILLPHRARSYRRNAHGHLVNAPAVDLSMKWAGGGFVSTAVDLVKFGEALLNDSLLQPHIKELFWQRQHLNNGNPINYGIGWALREEIRTRDGKLISPKLVYHTGGAVGCSSLLLLVPRDGIVLSMIVNIEGASLFHTGSEIERLIREQSNLTHSKE